VHAGLSRVVFSAVTCVVFLGGSCAPAIAYAHDLIAGTAQSHGSGSASASTAPASTAPPTRSNGAAPLDGSSGSPVGDLGLPHPDSSPRGLGIEGLASVDPSTGVARSGYRFDVPRPRGDLSLGVTLAYNSSISDSDAGVGWSLNVPSIERRSPASTAHPLYNDPPPGQSIALKTSGRGEQDQFVYGGSPLVPICWIADGSCAGNKDTVPIPDFAKSGGWHLYRLGSGGEEGLRFFWSPNHNTWVVLDSHRSEVVEFGAPLDDRADLGRTTDIENLYADGTSAPYSPWKSAVYRWKMSRRYDRHLGADGKAQNLIYYSWDSEGALRDIHYTPRPGFGEPWQQAFAHHIRLNYEPYEFFRAAGPQHVQWRNSPNKRLIGVDVASKEGDRPRELVRRYHLSYESHDHHSYLHSIQQEGRCAAPVTEDVAESLPNTNCPQLPARTMEYSQTTPDFRAPIVSMGPMSYPTYYGAPVHVMDINSDGLPDFFKFNSEPPNPHDLYLNAVEFPDRLSHQLMKFDSNANVRDRPDGIAYAADVYNKGVLGRFIETERYCGGAIPCDQFSWPNLSYLFFLPTNSGGQWHWAEPFPATVNYVEGDNSLSGLAAVGDLDGDGYIDRLVGQYHLSNSKHYVDRTGAALTMKDAAGTIRFFGEENLKVDSGSSFGVCTNGIVATSWQETIQHQESGEPDTNPFVNLADMDGDGFLDVARIYETYVEYWPGRGDGWFGVSACTGDSTGGLTCNCTADGRRMDGGPTVANPGRDHVYLHDVTGDGLGDFVVSSSTGISVWVNGDGTRWLGPQTIDAGSLPGWDPEHTQILFADMNASGVDDVVILVGADAQDTSVYYVDLLNRTRPGLLTKIHGERGAELAFQYLSIADASVISTLDKHPWKSQSPQPVQVVQAIQVVNGNTGARARESFTEYSYDDPEYDPTGRTFRGFRHVQTTRYGDGVLPTLITDTKYAIGVCGTSVCGPESRGGDETFDSVIHGLPVLSETYSTGPDGKSPPHYLSTTHRTYRLRELNEGMLQPSSGTLGRLDAFMLSLEQEDSWLYDPSATGTVTYPLIDDVLVPDGMFAIQSDLVVHGENRDGTRHLRTTRHVDDHGNEVESIAWGQVDGTADPAIVTSATWQDVGGSLPGLFRSQDRTVSYASGLPGPARTFHEVHSAAGDLTDVFADLDGTLPLLRHHEDATKAIAPLPPDASATGNHRVQIAHFDRDELGNVRRIEQPGGRCRGVQYDESFADLPTSVAVYTNGCENEPLTTLAKFDRGLGKPLMTTTPDGGVSTVEYDPFGRTHLQFAPNPDIPGMPSADPATSVDYFDDPVGARVHTKTQRSLAGQYQEQWEYSDGFEAPIASLESADPAAGDGGKWILHSLADRSQLGAIVRTHQTEFYNGDASAFDVNYQSGQPFERLEYDNFGRVQMRYALDGTPAVKVEHHPLVTTRWDAEDLDPASAHRDTPITVTTDGHGRVIATSEIFHNPAASRLTQVEYLATGEITRVTRSSGDGQPSYTRAVVYDTLGRLVANEEPNTGDWRYAYNDAGDVVGTSDARGCGKNVAHDGAGRVIAEDFSPCLNSQSDYSPPDLATGVGTEAFFVYDHSDADDSSPNLGAEGRVTAVYDRGAHTRMYYDGRGRTVGLARQIAKPGTPRHHLDERYSGHWFEKTFAYAADNSLLKESTGADIDELAAQDGTSDVTASYSLRGLPTQIAGSYGSLVTKSIYDFDGQALEVDYGDGAATKAIFGYDSLRRVHEVTLSRVPAGIWEEPPPFYDTPERAETAQLLLEHDVFSYDRLGNITNIDDQRDPDEWPDGAKPIKRAMLYDDLYRLTQVDYDSKSDSFSPPLADATGLGRVDNAVPYTETSKRVQQQSFAYDLRGNITSSTDDANLLYDRSLGTIQYQAAHPNQISQAGPRADGTGTDFVSAAYDPSGNLGALVVQRTKAACGDIEGCTQRFAYDWDEVGRLARARRWDFRGEYSPDAPAYPEVPSTNPDADLTFSYDGNGQRIVKEIKAFAGPTEYSVEVFGSLRLDHAGWNDIEEDYERTWDTETAYLTLGSATFGRVIYDWRFLPSPSISNQHVFLQIGDHLGSTSTVIDKETGELVEKATYQAFGAAETDYRPERWKSFREEYRFTGKGDDVQVGLSYFGARYYSAALGQWVSPDPLTIHGLGADLNPYAYVEGRALNAVDAFGFEVEGEVPSGGQEAQMEAPVSVSISPDGSKYIFLTAGDVAAVNQMIQRQNSTTPQERLDAAAAGMKAMLVSVAETVTNAAIKAVAVEVAGPQMLLQAPTVEYPKPVDPGANDSGARGSELSENYKAGGYFVQTIAAAAPFAAGGVITSLGAAAGRVGAAASGVGAAGDAAAGANIAVAAAEEGGGAGYLVRFGAEIESAETLGADAAKAEAAGFPHGVSTKAVPRISGSDKAHGWAPRSEIEEHFVVEQTGRNPAHHTVHLPNPVTRQAADLFNRLFRGE